MKKSFTVGQEVWRHSAGCAPVEGVVTKLTDWGVYVKDYISEHAHPYQNVYARPGDWLALSAKLDDDADFAFMAARRFSEEQLAAAVERGEQQ